MKCKTVCPACGEIVRTSSIGAFRHCGAQYDVRANLLAGETGKYEKMVAKYAEEEEPAKVEEKKPEVKPVEEIVKKVDEKKNDTPVVAPIIEEKPEPPKEKKVVKRKKKSEIVEKVKKEMPAEDVYSFGFFE